MRSASLFPGCGGQDGALILGRQVCGDFDAASRHEWLVTNGLGGFACGTVAGANTRRYHGFLMASLAPPGARTLLVAKVEVAATYQGVARDLGANEFTGGVLSPQGFAHLESFRLQEGVPTWIYAIGDALLRQQIFMAPGQNATYLRFDAFRTRGPIGLVLRPLVTWRDYHAQGRGARDFGVTPLAHGCCVQPPGGQPYWLQLAPGQFTAAPNWYWNFWHRLEAERGLDAEEDLFMPGYFGAQLHEGQPLHFIASLQPQPADGVAARDALLGQGRAVRAALPAEAPPWIQSLALAAQQFIVRREPRPPDTNAELTSIIAGYPWFADWGRDTLISLPGLAIELKRYDVAARILRTYLAHVDGGMLPNRFSDDGDRVEYNTADATLWLFLALDDYLKARRDMALAAEVFPVLMSILRAHQAGTRYGIRVDAQDGLLHAGEPGTQLTWMDARHGDHSFTPRVGKPVEINALWINALDITARLATRLRAGSERSFCLTALERALGSFARFWNAERGCLYDVLDTAGGAADASLRPNQILALALPICPLTPQQMRSTLDLCARELLTSYGLRSLAATEPGYRGVYEGGPEQRDAAYHMGTVWSWLLGPFARAHFRVYRDARIALSFLEPMQRHIDEACMGTISEIFDGDPPHRARGAFAQAWGVAEVLRTWLFLNRGGAAREAAGAAASNGPPTPPN